MRWKAISGPARIRFGAHDYAPANREDPRPRGSAIVFLESADVAAMHAAITARGGRPSEIEKVNRGKMRMFEVRDPDGHTVWFGQSYHVPDQPAPPRMLRQIMPALPFDDVPAGVAHYRDVLGFKANYQQHDWGSWIGTTFASCWSPGRNDKGIGSAYMYVRNADALYKKLRSRGAKVQGEPVSRPWASASSGCWIGKATKSGSASRSSDGCRPGPFFGTLNLMNYPESWPPLPLHEWQDTYRTLHMWTQIVGKIRMALAPPMNHWWHVTLYVNSHGLTTGPVPYPPGVFEIQFDFLNRELSISTSEGSSASRPLHDESVADFYSGTFEVLASLGIGVQIDPKPQEVADAVPFDRDYTHGSYDPDYAHRFWRILVSSTKVLERFRAKFTGKCSPVHFFWGSFDLACTRFSGRPAPPRKGVISGPAYSHEVCSAGFWPGGGAVDDPAYYSYTVPQPPGIEKEQIRPAAAGWNPQLSEFILMYDEVRRAASPEETLYEFVESTYNVGARLGKWDAA